MEKQTDAKVLLMHKATELNKKAFHTTDRQTDRQTHRQTHRQTDRQTDRVKCVQHPYLDVPRDDSQQVSIDDK